MPRIAFRRRVSLRALCLGAALVVAGGTGTAQASAAEAPTTAAADCDFQRTLCLWENAGHTGERFTVLALDPEAGTCVDLAEHGWANRAHSAVNTNSKPATLYTGTDCTGGSMTISGTQPSFNFGAQSVFVY